MSDKTNLEASALVRHGYPVAAVSKIATLTARQLELLLEIEVGPKAGQKFAPASWQVVMLPLAMALIDRYRAKNVRLWYDRCDLNNHLGFDLDSDHYEIVHFKHLDLVKNHNTEYFQHKNFHEADAVLLFFHDGKHKEWSMLPRQLDNLQLAKVFIEARREQMQHLYQGFASFSVPSIWNSGGTFYLGTTRLKQIRWRLGISLSKGDNPEWRVVRPGNNVVTRAAHFPTAIQYALQVWNWLEDDD
jgi:hypothetical protein